MAGTQIYLVYALSISCPVGWIDNFPHFPPVVVFVILIVALCCMGQDPPRSSRYAISFCTIRKGSLYLFGLDIAIILIKCANALKPPAKTPPEAKIKRHFHKQRLTFQYKYEGCEKQAGTATQQPFPLWLFAAP